MAVMRDITNYTNIMEGTRSTSPTVDNVFVSFSTPRAFQEATQQPTRPARPQLMQLISDSANNNEIAASLNELEHEISFLPSGLLTPTSPNDTNKPNFPLDSSRSCFVSPSKKLCVERDDETPLYQKLQRLSKSDLIDILSTLVYKKHPELQEEIIKLMPTPNLPDMEAKLRKLKRNIYKAFPYRGSHVGSTRDVFHYRRAHSHILEFKKECISQGKELVECRLWKTTVEYVLMAWSYINDLPTWDSPSHNSCKSACYKTLAVHFHKALNEGSFNTQECQHLKKRLEEACAINKHLQPCLNKVNQLLLRQ